MTGVPMITSSSKSRQITWVGTVALLLAGLLGSEHWAYAQQPQTSISPPVQGTMEKSAPSVFVPPDQNNRISPGDILNITIDDAPELSKLYRVSAAGTILMPFLGTVTAQQLTTEKL